jgi:hypothetical protein
MKRIYLSAKALLDIEEVPADCVARFSSGYEYSW